MDSWRVSSKNKYIQCVIHGEMTVYDGLSNAVHVISELAAFIVQACCESSQTFDTLKQQAYEWFEIASDVDFDAVLRDTIRQLHRLNILIHAR